MIRDDLTVSVPLRGFCFSTQSYMYHPYFVKNKFPSPYGDFVFQLGIAMTIHISILRVSVPLRGFCFSTGDGY